MVVLIAGASHTGKTMLAQKLMEAHGYPYLSIDHLKMGLIRSGNTALTVEDDDALTTYLWPIVREMVKTAIENQQNLIVEGCYIPFDWEKDFSPEYREKIRYVCLVMSQEYIENHFADIQRHAGDIEKRLLDDYTKEDALKDNDAVLALVQKHDVNYILIDDAYKFTFEGVTVC